MISPFAARLLFLLSILAVGAPAAPAAPAPGKKIVLIGGKKSHGKGQHDYPNGIPLIAALLKASAPFAGSDVLAYTTGFPEDPAALRDASTIVLYFDGMQKPSPLTDPKVVAQLRGLMAAGAGLVALHQASTLPAGTTGVPLDEWLGARRDGMFDRTEQSAAIVPASPGHPVSAGLEPFTCRDEFYPTLIFNRDAGRVIPILRANVTPESGDSIPKGETRPARDYVLAWAFERSGGGRSFGFTGGHYLAGWNEPHLRKLLLNAIAWTAGIDVPADGVTTTGPVVGRASVTRHENDLVENVPWGELRWYTAARMGNSRTMTTGVAILHPGQSNPRHFHPNCDEILHLVSGHIRHTMNEVTVEMNPGDTVSIPAGTLHNATNIGSTDAVMAISFSSAFRQAIGE